jgi:outer membrane protein OmpA-like peptidoglycan-associated protein
MTPSSRRSVPLKSAVSFAHALASAGIVLGTVLTGGEARAQQSTFHLDRLEVPGSPQDTAVLFVPDTFREATFYAQLGIGFQLNPLRLSNIASQGLSPGVFNQSDSNVITTQFSTYASVGFQFFDRLTLGATFPAAWVETGNQPNYSSVPFKTSATTNFQTGGPAVGDTRLDVRYVLLRSDDRLNALGVGVHFWAPTGAGSNTNFGGDGNGLEVMPMVTGQYTVSHLITLVANTGVHFRPENSINNPGGQSPGPKQGLGIGWEWRWAVGAFLPLANGKYRVGADIFGQTGLTDDEKITGNTIFTSQNTPIEWDLEGRMKFSALGSDRWYAGAMAGSFISPGYGAPDLRIVALIGWSVPIGDTNPNSPDARLRVHYKIHESMKDTDEDGIPDDIDACPEEPEDHKDPDPNDGCPAPSDRDGDGIPDKLDKCPDVPEDKDGIDDEDGCPEDDADGDGIPDAKDACPKEPGVADPDPKKNGCPKLGTHLDIGTGRIMTMQPVHFATGSATILADSFPMLQEVAGILKANPTIKRMRIEGHTDNRGAADMNLDLSRRRAASVRVWLTEHGIDTGRLESQGYGMTQPIDTNDTDAGRQRNRRVDFKILNDEAGGAGKPAPPAD